MTLNYLFLARFHDGTSIQQTAADVSVIQSGKSAFFDVEQRISEVDTFTIANGPRNFSVDLKDGSFRMNGVRFQVGDPFKRVPEGERELIYFRRRTEHYALDRALKSEECEHHLGWRIKGKTYAVTICVDN